MNYLRIKKAKVITDLLKKGRRVHSDTLTVVYAPSLKTAMAVCVGKKYGKSTQRNRIKRLLREAFRLRVEELAVPCSFLLIPRVAETYSFSDYARDLKKIIGRERLNEAQRP